MNKDGSNFSVIFSFTNTFKHANGFYPIATLLKGPNGQLYGTTTAGGTNNAGTAFSLDYNGNNFTLLHAFGGSGDGNDPYFPLIVSPDGQLYGTTISGGGGTASGTVYGLIAACSCSCFDSGSGGRYTVPIAFTAGMGGAPNGLIAASDGALYGTCNIGGTANRGTIFKLTASGVITNEVINPPANVGGTNWCISGHGASNQLFTILSSTNITVPMSN
jgi:uncharacterized repeat protein (TIGR03803 family)